jgi:hypothetical protein
MIKTIRTFNIIFRAQYFLTKQYFKSLNLLAYIVRQFFAAGERLRIEKMFYEFVTIFLEKVA